VARPQPKFLAMRWSSTVKSFSEGQPTWLACIELAAAYACAAWIVIDGKYIGLVLAGTITAPLFLLRTPRSVKYGLVLLFRYIAWSGDTGNRYEWRVLPETGNHYGRRVLADIKGFLIILLMPFVALVIRFVATAISFVEQPASTVAEIPQNWFRQAFCLDLAHVPELVPGIETEKEDRDWRPLFSKFRDELYGGWVARDESFGSGIFLLLVALLLFLPSTVYRIAFKMTSLVWLPLIWCVGPFAPSSTTVREKLEDIRFGVIDKLALTWSAVVVFAFLFKLHISAFLSASSVTFLERELILVTYPWHVAACINGTLAWLLFVFADIQLRQMTRGRGWADSTIVPVLRTAIFVRRFLALYIVANALALIVAEARQLGHVHFVWKWLSWYP
jgi:hypothetical protein